MSLADVVFGARKEIPVMLSIRLAAGGPGLDSSHQLQNINNPASPETLDAEELADARTAWTVTAEHLARVPGNVDSMQLYITNTSFYAGQVTVFMKAEQEGQPLFAGHAGVEYPRNENGEIVLGTLASGEHDFSLVSLSV